MKVKVYDFDRSWDAPDGKDDWGDYVIRELDREYQPFGIVSLKNGTSSHTWRRCEEEQG